MAAATVWPARSIEQVGQGHDRDVGRGADEWQSTRRPPNAAMARIHPDVRPGCASRAGAAGGRRGPRRVQDAPPRMTAADVSGERRRGRERCQGDGRRVASGAREQRTARPPGRRRQWRPAAGVRPGCGGEAGRPAAKPIRITAEGSVIPTTRQDRRAAYPERSDCDAGGAGGPRKRLAGATSPRTSGRRPAPSFDVFAPEVAVRDRAAERRQAEPGAAPKISATPAGPSSPGRSSFVGGRHTDDVEAAVGVDDLAGPAPDRSLAR